MKIKTIRDVKKEIKIVGELIVSFIPKSKSDKKNKIIASKNIGK